MYYVLRVSSGFSHFHIEQLILKALCGPAMVMAAQVVADGYKSNVHMDIDYDVFQLYKNCYIAIEMVVSLLLLLLLLLLLYNKHNSAFDK
jgi:uncharacterized membrane protein YidH (DUF202 family)